MTRSEMRALADRYLSRFVSVLEYKGCFHLAVALLVCIALFTYRSYGFTTDEDRGYLRAIGIFEYYVQGVSIPFDGLHFYGAMPDVLALLLERMVPPLGIQSRHLVSAAFGILGIVYVYKLAEHFIDRRSATIALVLLSVNPMWFGYMFFNLKDIPYASLLLCSYYYCMKILAGGGQTKLSYLKLLVSVGLLSVTKVIGVAMLALFVLISLCVFVLIPGSGRLAPDRRLLFRVVGIGAAAFIGVLIFLPAFWPQSYLFTPAQALEAATKFLHYDTWRGVVLIHGESIPADATPFYYMAAYIAISMPVFILLLLMLSPLSLLNAPNRIVISAASIVGFMLVYQAVSGARVYNGYRHFLFLIPFVTIIAAYAASFFIARGLLRWRLATALVLCFGSAAAVAAQFRLFPYQYTDYNAFVGGVRGAEGRYYIDVWRSAGTESYRELQRLAEAAGRPVSVFTCAPSINARLFHLVKPVSNVGQAEYLISSPRGCPADSGKFQGARTVFEVRRDHALLSAIHLNADFAPHSKMD